MIDKNYKKVNYSAEIEIAKSPQEVFDHLVKLSEWWPEEFVGNKIKLNDEFVFKTGDDHYSKNRVIEFRLGKKLAWIAINSLRKLDGFDWTGTKFIFELIPVRDHSLLKFTYNGVIIENEYDRLVQICNMTLKMFYDSITNHNEHKNFTASIEVEKLPHEVFNIITSDVSKWWGGKDFEGNSSKFNDEFIIHHPNAHFSKQKLIEVIPNKKIVWLVTDSTLHWLKKDVHEWTNTKMIFEITAKTGKTLLQFTHEGLTPEKECFSMCEKGWTMVIKDWLFNFMRNGIVASQLFASK